MGFFSSLGGLALITVSWFDFFGFVLPLRTALFILGFDMMGIVPKIGLFVVYLFYPVFGTAFGYFAWTLLLLFGVELLLTIVTLGLPLNLITKPVAVFMAGYVALGLQPALILAGVDFIYNLTHRIRL